MRKLAIEAVAFVLIMLVLRLALWLFLASFARDSPRPGSGAASVEELVALYTEAHRAKDPERYLRLDLVRALTNWGSSKQTEAIVRGLSELELEEARAVEMPLMDPEDQLLDYVNRKPNGELRTMAGSRPTRTAASYSGGVVRTAYGWKSTPARASRGSTGACT
jgi:hypothetical protein